MADWVEQLAASVDVPAKVVAVAIVLWGSFPIALVFNQIPHRLHIIRHLFSLFVSGMFYCFLFSANGFMQMMANATLVYLITSQFRHNIWNPYFTFVFTMSTLLFNHYYAAYWTDVDRFDNTAPMMVMVIKLTSFAWSAYDGTLKVTDKTDSGTKSRRIEKYPDFISFMGYCTFFTSFLVGPACEYMDYERFIQHKPPFDKVPSPLKPFLKTTAIAVACLFVYLKYGSEYTFFMMMTDEFQTYSFVKKWILFTVVGIVTRTKYYTAWKMTEAASNLIGFGYQGADPRSGVESWERGRNANIFYIELPENARMMIGNWNINTSKWLRYHVYNRFMRADGKNAGWVTMITFTTSALWHGFKPGFFFSFVFMAFTTMTGRLLRRHIRPWFLQGSPFHFLKPVFDFLGMLCSISAGNYAVATFILLDWDKCWKVWATMHYYQHIFMAIVIISFRFLGMGSVLEHAAKKIGVPEASYKKDKADKED